MRDLIEDLGAKIIEETTTDEAYNSEGEEIPVEE